MNGEHSSHARLDAILTRAALWAANRAEFVEVLFGVPKLGAIASPLDHWRKWNDARAGYELR